VIYIANDVEAAGKRLGFHPTLSLGACLVTREKLDYADYQERGLIFYAEIKPHSMECEIDAMRVGCLHLECLEEVRQSDSRYDPTSQNFNPKLVLERMRSVCEDPRMAMERFREWVRRVTGGKWVQGVIDTAFFDSGHVNLCFGTNTDNGSPFGWGGIELNSLHRGYTGRKNAKLKQLGVPDTREKPHRADHDAVLLAQVARVLLYEKLGW